MNRSAKTASFPATPLMEPLRKPHQLFIKCWFVYLLHNLPIWPSTHLQNHENKLRLENTNFLANPNMGWNLSSYPREEQFTNGIGCLNNWPLQFWIPTLLCLFLREEQIVTVVGCLNKWSLQFRIPTLLYMFNSQHNLQSILVRLQAFPPHQGVPQ
jgi:hypothetical protein